jgi:hypothetical protein
MEMLSLISTVTGRGGTVAAQADDVLAPPLLPASEAEALHFEHPLDIEKVARRRFVAGP